MLASLVALAGLGGCTPSDPPSDGGPGDAGPIGEPVTETIGAGGGSITSADGALTLEVPAGALDADTDITITRVAVEALGEGFEELSGYDRVWVYELSPDGLTFAVPVSVTMETGVGVGDSAESYAAPFGVLATRSGERVEPVAEGRVVADLDEGTVSLRGELTHFSMLVGYLTDTNLFWAEAHIDRSALPVGETFVVRSFILSRELPAEGEYIDRTFIDDDSVEPLFLVSEVEVLRDLNQPGDTNIEDGLDATYGCSERGTGLWRTRYSVRIRLGDTVVLGVRGQEGLFGFDLFGAAVFAVAADATVEPPPVVFEKRIDCLPARISGPRTATAVTTPGTSIPDADDIGVEATVTIDEPACARTAGLEVDVGVDHTDARSVELQLVGPGSFGTLQVGRGGFSSISIDGAFPTQYSPEEPLTPFLGRNPNGTWALTAIDSFPGDTGTLERFGVRVICVTPELCGDGALDAGEQCDDGNTDPGDGCTASCTRETGFACPTPGGPCAATCGDGVLDAGEECDDGNTDELDGCSRACRIEEPDRTACVGEPSLCVTTRSNIGQSPEAAIPDGDPTGATAESTPFSCGRIARLQVQVWASHPAPAELEIDVAVGGAPLATLAVADTGLLALLPGIFEVPLGDTSDISMLLAGGQPITLTVRDTVAGNEGVFHQGAATVWCVE